MRIGGFSPTKLKVNCQERLCNRNTKFTPALLFWAGLGVVAAKHGKTAQSFGW